MLPVLQDPTLLRRQSWITLEIGSDWRHPIVRENKVMDEPFRESQDLLLFDFQLMKLVRCYPTIPGDCLRHAIQDVFLFHETHDLVSERIH